MFLVSAGAGRNGVRNFLNEYAAEVCSRVISYHICAAAVACFFSRNCAEKERCCGVKCSKLYKFTTAVSRMRRRVGEGRNVYVLHEQYAHNDIT